MMHRLRFAMTQHGMIEKLRGVVEVDEVWIGPRERGKAGVPGVESKKRPVVSLMERTHNGSRVRSFPVERATLNNIKPIMREHVEVGSRIQTDEATVYHYIHDEFPDHDVVTHKKHEYSRWENGRHITTNTVEGFFGLVKRGVFGIYHHWGRGYLQQYLNEFDFRYNHRKVNDSGEGTHPHTSNAVFRNADGNVRAPLWREAEDDALSRIAPGCSAVENTLLVEDQPVIGV